jgi:hypothetical protein
LGGPCGRGIYVAIAVFALAALSPAVEAESFEIVSRLVEASGLQEEIERAIPDHRAINLDRPMV